MRVGSQGIEGKRAEQQKGRQGWVSRPILLAREEMDRQKTYGDLSRFARSIPGEVLLFFLMFFLVDRVGYVWFGREVLKASLEIGLLSGKWITVAQFYLHLFIIGGTFLFVRLVEHRSFAAMGFRREGWLRRFLGGCLLGFAVFSLVVLGTLFLCQGKIRVSPYPPGWSLWILLGGFFVQGVAEEVQFRGFLFLSVARNHPPYLAAFISGIIFSLTHLGNPGLTPRALGNIALVGFFLSLLMMLSEEIWLVSGFHACWNFAQGNIFGLPVSGLKVGDSLLVISLPPGNDLLTGGSFGVEAGIVTTGIYAVLTLVLMGWLLKKRLDSLRCQRKLPISPSGT